MAVQKPWLDLHFIEKILQNSENDNSIKVIDISSKQFTVEGDNYSSDLIRIVAEFQHDEDNHKVTTQKSMIVKSLPVNGKFIKESDLFQREISMISNTLKKMNKLLEPTYRLSGKALYVQKENPIFLVIEDLTSLGFRLVDREVGFDLSHCMLAIHGLARFHAASVALCEKEPEQKVIYSLGTFIEDCPQDIKNFFIRNTKAVADEIAQWPELKKYSEKIAKLSKNIYKVGIDTTKLSEDEFNVINHGDCWINNMMFKYDKNGTPIEHIFLDFQLSFYSSPAIDILNFLSTSLSPDITKDEIDILLIEYINIMAATMKQLKCKTQPLTLEILKTTLKQRIGYGMISTFVFLPIVLCPRTDAINLDHLINNSASLGLKTQKYKKLLMQRLPIYDKLGLLDL